jgi:hypothetical protein
LSCEVEFGRLLQKYLDQLKKFFCDEIPIECVIKEPLTLKKFLCEEIPLDWVKSCVIKEPDVLKNFFCEEIPLYCDIEEDLVVVNKSELYLQGNDKHANYITIQKREHRDFITIQKTEIHHEYVNSWSINGIQIPNVTKIKKCRHRYFIYCENRLIVRFFDIHDINLKFVITFHDYPSLSIDGQIFIHQILLEGTMGRIYSERGMTQFCLLPPYKEKLLEQSSILIQSMDFIAYQNKIVQEYELTNTIEIIFDKTVIGKYLVCINQLYVSEVEKIVISDKIVISCKGDSEDKKNEIYGNMIKEDKTIIFYVKFHIIFIEFKAEKYVNPFSFSTKSKMERSYSIFMDETI